MKQLDKKTERALREYLREGEQICWHGGAEKFPLLGKDNRTKVLGKWGLTAACAAVVLILYLNSGSEVSIATAFAIVFVAVVLMLAPVTEYLGLLHQQYWITNQRILLMTWDRAFYSMEFHEVDAFRVEKDHAAKPCLVIGSSVFDEIDRLLRWRACHPKVLDNGTHGTDRAEGMVFYCVSDHQGLVDQLQKKCGKSAA